MKITMIKVDQLIAVGENLIQMKSSNDMQKLEGLTDASSNAKSDPAHNLDSKNHEATHHIRFTELSCNTNMIDHLFPVRCCLTSCCLSCTARSL